MATQPITVGELVRALAAEPLGLVDNTVPIQGTCPVERYRQGCVTFVRTEKYAKYLDMLKGAIVLIPPGMRDLASICPQNTYLVVKDVPGALFTLQDLFYANRDRPTGHGLAATAVVAPSARIGADVYVGDYCWIGDDVTIGDRTKIVAHVYVGDGTTLGSDTIVYPNVTIYPGCRTGSSCIIHAGVVIGAEGFRFEHDYENRRVLKLIHVGGVSVGDRVEIGANCTIDRASFEHEMTSLEDDVKLDDQVHIGHNARIGARSLLAAQTCISGSVVVEEDVWIGAGVTVANGVTLGKRSVILVNAVVAYDVPEGQRVSGFYAMPHSQWKRAFEFMKLLGK